MTESKADRFVAEARKLAVSDEFYEAYKAQATADRDRLRSLLSDLAGEVERVMPAEVERAAGPVTKEGLLKLLQGMRLEQRVHFARIVAGEWW